MPALDLKLWLVGLCFLIAVIFNHQLSIKQAEVDLFHAAGVETSYVKCLKYQPDKPCSSSMIGPARISIRRDGVEIIFRKRSSGV